MKKFIMATFLFFIISTSIQAASHDIHTSHAKAFLKNLFDDNTEYVNKITHENIKILSEQQRPRATVLACSDSRVQANAFHKSPLNDLFFIRNIGNQLISTEGSIEYGIYRLNTPVLLIIGHSDCGAIHAATNDYTKETIAIQRELKTLQLSKGLDINEGVIKNINNQVEYAIHKFKDKVSKNQLVVVGVLYDFRDDFSQGYGRLILINLNGEQNPEKLRSHDYIKDIKNVYFHEKK